MFSGQPRRYTWAGWRIPELVCTDRGPIQEIELFSSTTYHGKRRLREPDTRKEELKTEFTISHCYRNSRGYHERQTRNEENHLCLLEKWGQISFFLKMPLKKNPARVRFKKKKYKIWWTRRGLKKVIKYETIRSQPLPFATAKWKYNQRRLYMDCQQKYKAPIKL